MAPGHLVVAVGGEEEQGERGDPATEEAQQVQAGRIGPVQVLQEQDERLVRRSSARRFATAAKSAAWLVPGPAPSGPKEVDRPEWLVR